MTSKIVVNNIEADSGINTVTFASNIQGNLIGNVTGTVNSTGVITATSFSGDVTGNVTGNLTGTASTATAAATAYGLSGSPTLSGITSVSTTNLTVNGNAYPSAGPLSNRNIIINGAMQVAQRGTSVAMAHDGTASAFIADRFQFVMENADALDGNFAQVSNDSPDGFPTSIKWTTSTIEAAVSADDLVEVRHPIEAQNLQHLDFGTAGAKSLTVSFWVKSSETGTYGLTLYQGDGDDIIGTTYTIDTADTWEYKTHTFAGNTIAAISNDNGLGLELNWMLFVGSNYTSTDNTSWGSSSNAKRGYGHTANGVAGTTSATWLLTGVQLEVGTVATPFEHRSFGDELARCQRYFQLISSGSEVTVGSGSCTGTTTADIQRSLMTTMRSTPTLYNTMSGATLFRLNSFSINVNTTSSPTLDGTITSPSRLYLYFSGFSGLTGGDGCAVRNSPSASGVLGVSAEL